MWSMNWTGTGRVRPFSILRDGGGGDTRQDGSYLAPVENCNPVMIAD